jgi:hypothetical protein
MNLKSLWSALEEAYEPLDSYPNTVLMKLISELNLPPGWFTWFAAAVLFGAEPITTENYMHLFPYGWALIERGWVEESSGVYQITSKGKQVRAEVEAETERLFFAPWSCLEESELAELASLAEGLRDGLMNLARNEGAR